MGLLTRFSYLIKQNVYILFYQSVVHLYLWTSWEYHCPWAQDHGLYEGREGVKALGPAHVHWELLGGGVKAHLEAEGEKQQHYSTLETSTTTLSVQNCCRSSMKCAGWQQYVRLWPVMRIAVICDCAGLLVLWCAILAMTYLSEIVTTDLNFNEDKCSSVTGILFSRPINKIQLQINLNNTKTYKHTTHIIYSFCS